MNITKKRTSIILDYLRDNHYMEGCTAYGERGYSNPELGILFADWNPISRTVQDYLEEAGYALEWSDEWYVDHENDKAWRTSGNSYHWVCSVRFCDGYVLTPDDDISAWIDECAVDSPNDVISTLPDWITPDDILEQGYELFADNLENGFHPGQTDNPQDVTKKALASGAQSVLFRISEHSQFYVVFECYVMKGDE
jgi:hypothetical protein